jgi:hypothetical protein
MQNDRNKAKRVIQVIINLIRCPVPRVGIGISSSPLFVIDFTFAVALQYVA